MGHKMGDTAATMQCLDVVIFRPASGLLGCYASPAFCHSDSHWVSTTVHLDLCLEGRIWKMKVSTILESYIFEPGVLLKNLS